MDEICWNCQHFEHNSALGPVSGRCRRHAPRGLDVNGLLQSAFFSPYNVQMGKPSGVVYVFGDAVELWGDYGTASSKTTGYGAEVWPMIPAMYDSAANTLIRGGTFVASLVNTHAATKSETVIVLVDLFEQNGTARNLLETYEWEIDGDDVGVIGNVVENFVCIHKNFGPILEPVGGKLIGAAIHLVDNDPDYVGEIKNPMISLELTNSPPINIDNAFPWILSGNVEMCGEFRPKAGTIPELP